MGLANMKTRIKYVVEIVKNHLLHHPFWLQLVLVLFVFGNCFSTFYTTCLAKITDEGSVPEMRIWSISLI